MLKRNKTAVQAGLPVKESGVDPYSTKRMSSVTAFAWKKKMLARDIQEIQEVCQKSMEAFGYVSMVNITRDQQDEDFLPFRPLHGTNLNTVGRTFNQPPANTMSHP